MILKCPAALVDIDPANAALCLILPEHDAMHK
jgi:hypothetical protein